jgi:signal transduction histidine kinase
VDYLVVPLSILTIIFFSFFEKNAIKFTNKGEVFSRYSVMKVDGLKADEVMLSFECHDTGPGFDAKDEESMFKPFSQIDGSSTRVHGGSGLGLVISRQLVELHGGSLTAKSVKGQGSYVNT